jgi:hypothetical protein
MKLISKVEGKIRVARAKFDSELSWDFTGGQHDNGDALINIYYGKGSQDVIP